MCLVRVRTLHAAEAGETPGPVTLACTLVCDEVLKHDRMPALPLASGVAIIRNTRIGAAAGAGQQEQPGVAVDEIDQRI